MHPGVGQIALGLACLIAGILIIKPLANDWGWLVFLLGVVIASKGGIAISQSGAKEIGN